MNRDEWCKEYKEIKNRIDRKNISDLEEYLNQPKEKTLQELFNEAGLKIIENWEDMSTFYVQGIKYEAAKTYVERIDNFTAVQKISPEINKTVTIKLSYDQVTKKVETTNPFKPFDIVPDKESVDKVIEELKYRLKNI